MPRVPNLTVGVPTVDKNGDITMGDGDVTKQTLYPTNDSLNAEMMLLKGNLSGDAESSKISQLQNSGDGGGGSQAGTYTPPPETTTDDGSSSGEDVTPDKVYGLDKADYFANTAEVTQQANAKLIEDQLAAESAALGVLEKTQAQNQDAGEQIYGAEYSNRQMTDKFGWTGGQLMDSETRMQALRDQLSAGILSNEQYIDTKYANDITKAKAAMVTNRMAIAQQAAKDAYSSALAVGQLTGVYIDPIASDLVGRYVTSVANNPEGTIDPALEKQLIASGFYREVDGVKELHTEAVEAISGVINSLDRDSWTMGMKTALLEQGYSVDEVNNLMSTEELIAAGTDVETADDPYAPDANVTGGEDEVTVVDPIPVAEDEEVENGDTKTEDGVNYIVEGDQWVEQTFAGIDGRQVQGMTEEEYIREMGYNHNADGTWTKMTDEERVATGKFKNASGQWVDWHTDPEGIKAKYTSTYESLYGELNTTQETNEYDAALEYFKESNFAKNSAELLSAYSAGAEVTITPTSKNDAGKGYYNDEFKISWEENGQTKTLLTRGANLLMASAFYGTDFGKRDEMMKIYMSESRESMWGNKWDGSNRIFQDYWNIDKDYNWLYDWDDPLTDAARGKMDDNQETFRKSN